MKLSIVIPIYNVGKYVRKTIDSVTNQTYDNLEIVCVNDGSTDDCPQMLSAYAAQDKRIKVVNQQNQGTYIARQVGVEAAEGDYIVFLDGDDELKPDACAQIVSMVNETDADIVQFGITILADKHDDEFLRWITRFLNPKKGVFEGSENMIRKCYVEEKLPWNVIGKAIRSSVAKQAFRDMDQVRFSGLDDYVSTFYIYLYADKLYSSERKLYNYNYGVGISYYKMKLDGFAKYLLNYQGYETLRHYIEKRTEKGSEIYRIVDEVMREFILNAILNRTKNLSDEVSSQEWANEFAKTLGTEKALGALASRIVILGKDKERLIQKNRKHLRQFKMLLGLLLLVLIMALCLRFF